MKILVFAGKTGSLIYFRRDLLKNMLDNNHEVIAIGPELDRVDEIEKLGIKFIKVEFDRLSVNPINDLKLIGKLFKIMKKEKIDLYFGYTIKPAIYGVIAAKLAGVKYIYSMITGLGSIFIDGKEKKIYLKEIVKKLYKIAFLCNTKVFFQNEDDVNDVIKMKLISRKKCFVVNGSGINLEEYKPTIMPKENIFLFVGSLMGDKGIREYIEASLLVKKNNESARFWIIGPIDGRLTSISKSEMDEYIKNGIEYFGEVNNVIGYLDKCRFYVLPSYREGTPRSVLEAMAKGRPIITTDAPGCRQTVENGVNGFLVPIKDSKSIAEKMVWLIDNDEFAEKMGKESLRIVRKKYDVHVVNQFMLECMKIKKI